MKRATRIAVFEKSGGRCGYCGCDITLQTMQVDHVRPQVSGGTDAMGNLLAACRPCNNYKLFFTLEEFRSMIANQINLLRRNATNYRHAERFGLVKATVPEAIEFYFERASRPSAPGGNSVKVYGHGSNNAEAAVHGGSANASAPGLPRNKGASITDSDRIDWLLENAIYFAVDGKFLVAATRDAIDRKIEATRGRP